MTDLDETTLSAGDPSGLGPSPLGRPVALDPAQRIAHEHNKNHVFARLFGHEPQRSRLARYVVLDVLGQGGMGTVYAAYDDKLDRKVALKLLRSPDDADARTGAVLGTPAYMAPEQLAGLTPDARADQFSFCVSLWEALFGQRPFSASSREELLRTIEAGRVELPAKHDVPAWLRKVVERGLAAAPRDRWPSMAALLDALAADPSYRRRWLIVGGGLLSLAIAGGAGLYLGEVSRRDAAIAACEAEGRRIDEVWNPEIRDRLARGFEATALPFATDAWTRTAARLDDHARTWATLRTSACLEPEAAVRESTAACLDEQLAALAGVLEAWDAPERATVTNAVSIAAGLFDLEQCTDQKWLALRVAPAGDDRDGAREQIAAARAKLERAAALQAGGRYDEALALTKQVVSAAEALAWTPLLAEAHQRLGLLHASLGDHEAARATLEQAYYEAGRSAHDLVALDAASKLTLEVGQRLALYDQGEHWGRVALMLVDRLDLRGSVRHAHVLDHLGSIAQARNEPERALELYREALAIREATLGPEHPSTAISINNIAVIHWQRGDYDEALALVEQALALHEAALGPAHPEYLGTLVNVGLVELDRKNLERAHAALRRALDGYASSLGPDHMEVATASLNLALVELERARLDAALAAAKDASEVFERKLGADHPYSAYALWTVGNIELRREQWAAAIAAYERALELGRGREGPLFDVAEAEASLAKARAGLESTDTDGS